MFTNRTVHGTAITLYLFHILCGTAAAAELMSVLVYYIFQASRSIDNMLVLNVSTTAIGTI